MILWSPLVVIPIAQIPVVATIGLIHLLAKSVMTVIALTAIIATPPVGRAPAIVGMKFFRRMKCATMELKSLSLVYTALQAA